jgi:hypothetical protein
MFDAKDTPKKLYRTYNMIIAAVVLFEYIRQPEAAAMEYIPDIALHAFEAMAPDSMDSLSFTANLARISQAGYSFWSGESTIPSIANAVDVYNHTYNLSHRLSNMLSR